MMQNAEVIQNGRIGACGMVGNKQILKYKRGEESHVQIVLALVDGQYITWGYNVSTGGFFWGHYFGDDLAAAVADYDKRS